MSRACIEVVHDSSSTLHRTWRRLQAQPVAPSNLFHISVETPGSAPCSPLVQTATGPLVHSSPDTLAHALGRMPGNRALQTPHAPIAA